MVMEAAFQIKFSNIRFSNIMLEQYVSF